jgi:basic amino acid/polyamine antiporter, APA family
VAVGWSRYFVTLLTRFHVEFLPQTLTSSPLNTVGDTANIVATGSWINLPAVFIALLITYVCYVGIRQSALVNNIVVAIKVTIVLAVIAFGAFYINPSNWHPFIPPNTGTFGAFGWSGILRASGIIFFAYVGFDAVSTAAQEARNPTRDMAIGILGGLVICTVLYILMSGVLTGLLAYPLLNDAAPVAVALAAHPELSWLTTWVIVGALAGLTSVILVQMLAQARIFLSMSHHGLLPKLLGRVHPRFRTPYVATLITGTTAALAGGLLPLGLLGELVSIGTLIAFIVVCIGVLVLRRTRPDLHRPFRVPAVWPVAIAGIGMCVLMLAFLPMGTWVRLIVWTVVGLVIYWLYGYRNSRLRQLPLEDASTCTAGAGQQARSG